MIFYYSANRLLITYLQAQPLSQILPWPLTQWDYQVNLLYMFIRNRTQSLVFSCLHHGIVLFN